MKGIFRSKIGIDPTCVLYLPMDGFMSGAIVRDHSQYHNNGTVYGASFCYPGLKFDGVDDFVNIPNLASLRKWDEITVMVWVKSLQPTWNAYRALVNKETGKNQWMLSTDKNSTSVGFYWYDGTSWRGSGEVSIEGITKWNFIAAAKNDTYVKIFINGELKLTADGTAPIQEVSGTPVYIGRGENYYLNAIIDEVRIYNRYLNPSEIFSHYELTRWKFGM